MTPLTRLTPSSPPAALDVGAACASPLPILRLIRTALAARHETAVKITIPPMTSGIHDVSSLSCCPWIWGGVDVASFSVLWAGIFITIWRTCTTPCVAVNTCRKISDSAVPGTAMRFAFPTTTSASLQTKPHTASSEWIASGATLGPAQSQILRASPRSLWGLQGR